MAGSPLQTEFDFTLPQGYTDEEGTLHREGRMRLATAADEIEPLQDPRVQSNSSYLTVILLSRVVTELGDLDVINRNVIENLYVADLEYLQAMYERINNQGDNTVETACPDCGQRFDVSVYDGAVVETAGPDAAGAEMGAPGTPGGDGDSGN
ncbi:MAG: hypothetical protein V5A44_03390 [Haloarculaceae archaeon]